MSIEDTTAYPTPSQSESRRKSKKRPREAATEQTPIKKSKKNSTQESKDLPADIDVAATPISTKGTSQSEAQIQQSTELSPFFNERLSFYITLSPVAYRFALDGAIAEHISPLLLTYYPPVNGVILAFENATLSSHPDETGETLGQSIDEYAATYIWLTADFLVFRPSKGTELEGVISLQNEGTLGLLCYNYFNAGIDREQIPDKWRWVEETEAEEDEKHTAGHFVDGHKRVEGCVSFKVKDFEASINDGGAATINIYGSMLRDQVVKFSQD